jgi:hypothetical protein
VVAVGFRVRVPGGLGILFVGWRGVLGVRARCEGSPEISEDLGASGKKERRRKKH